MEERSSSVSNIYDFGDYDRARQDDLAEFKTKCEVMSARARAEEQRRRLEHFLAVAKKARANADVVKIKELLRELLASGKCLPQWRISQLKRLEVMTSPYN